ncbi:Cof-type HAD-IIB family hydrolase [Priestia taiwanensis]|uniref:Hydrolase n=1 Tax=Priestia taiwanensis TaxID=1347902 RepID=A0A917EQA5_9BACI|nr:Cof-type HAD-IIB family hydrolase [Priestia taiwanensis]MBM7364186.1 Cof subfamily protein (haloacid dehalogenase superfamily) [Priestia taiwanensis]GGE72341.1 hydrolase [Priestia taiwanensis]
MQKHLIALDLDGTLLKDDKTISDRSKQVLQKAREQGHYVVISTGRPYRASEIYYNELQLDSPIVNFNGAYVHHPLDSSWEVQHTPLDVNIAKNIIQECREIGIKNVLAEVIDDVYIHYPDESLDHIFQMGNPNIFMGDPLDTLRRDPTCLLIDADEEEVEKVRTHLSNVHAEVIDHRRWAAPWHVIEIVRTGLSKAVGLQRIAEYYNIPQERIIAFGDEDNDFEMIEYAGYGIAMGNAIDELKNRANDVTLTNEEDGIAIYLEKLLKL